MIHKLYVVLLLNSIERNNNKKEIIKSWKNNPHKNNVNSFILCVLQHTHKQTHTHNIVATLIYLFCERHKKFFREHVFNSIYFPEGTLKVFWTCMCCYAHAMIHYR